jgi:hypothetical protein
MQPAYRAAWVPDDNTGRPWGEASALAVEWIERECAEQAVRPVLVLNSHNTPNPELAGAAGIFHRTTPGSKMGNLPAGPHPVYAYVPTTKALDLAIRLAGGSSLVVVETDSYPVAGWAQQVGAADLTRPDVEPAPLDPRLTEAVERLKTYRDISKMSDRKQATVVLRGLRAQGLLNPDVLPGVLAANGFSERSITAFAKLIASL